MHVYIIEIIKHFKHGGGLVTKQKSGNSGKCCYADIFIIMSFTTVYFDRTCTRTKITRYGQFFLFKSVWPDKKYCSPDKISPVIITSAGHPDTITCHTGRLRSFVSQLMMAIR